jgi:hypothetical protein
MPLKQHVRMMAESPDHRHRRFEVPGVINTAHILADDVASIT